MPLMPISKSKPLIRLIRGFNYVVPAEGRRKPATVTAAHLLGASVAVPGGTRSVRLLASFGSSGRA
jgi:hypothetical protein